MSFDLLQEVLCRVKIGLWDRLAQRRHSLQGLEHGVQELATLQWYHRLKDGPWKHTVLTLLADGLYTPWRGHQRHGRPHLCPDGGAPFADTEHMLWDCEKLKRRLTAKQRWVHNSRMKAGGQPLAFWNCGLVPAAWTPTFDSPAVRDELGLSVEGIADHGDVVWIDGGCASHGVRARAGLGVFWAPNLLTPKASP